MAKEMNQFSILATLLTIVLISSNLISIVALKVITIVKDGSRDFKMVADAVKSIPLGNTKRMVIKIGGGEYREKITIDKSKTFITFLGDPKGMPKIVFDGTTAKYGTMDNATVAVERLLRSC
ncbi:hypothetical protein Pint_13573 [Pistacia integerrima]|uniref:Uncharacterized protein n=1 Tax=Pistacia integerrima TaxID=434235 RepID=A0ACC0YC75_9ROSI|nr:hypothetical protein Pint_13573 [Pistacia integerrima]